MAGREEAETKQNEEINDEEDLVELTHLYYFRSRKPTH